MHLTMEQTVLTLVFGLLFGLSIISALDFAASILVQGRRRDSAAGAMSLLSVTAAVLAWRMM